MKILLYPCTPQNVEYVTEFIKVRINDKTNPICFKGMIKDDKDISFLNNWKKKNILISSNINSALEWCEEVYILSHEYGYIGEEMVIDVCKQAIDKNKNIHIFSEISLRNREVLNKYRKNSLIWYYEKKNILEIENIHKLKFEGLYEINLPVIFVGKSNNIVKNDYAFLALYEKLIEKGYSVCALTENLNGLLLQCEVIDFSKLIKEVDCDEAILFINRCVKLLIDKMKYDVVLVHLNKAATKFNDLTPNGFGVEQIIMSESLYPDYYVHCILGNQISDISQYMYYLKNKLIYNVDCICTNNEVLDKSEYSIHQKLVVNYMDCKKMEKQYKEYFAINDILFSQENDFAQKLAERVIDKLGENNE